MKELSKVPLIKKFISLDPANPGVISKQRYVSAGGKKSKVYYLWQSSILGEKQSIRIPKESVGAIKQFITAAEDKAKREDSKTISALKSYKKALETLMAHNKKVRDGNNETDKDATKEDKERQKQIKTLDRIINKHTKKSSSK